MVTLSAQPVTFEQLARLYQARNEANSLMAKANRSKDRAMISAAKETAKSLDSAYDAARRLYKRQQKASNKALTT